MDSIYKKVKNNTATDFEKNALSKYYGVISLKENEYVEYKYRKQKFLIELDNENVKNIKGLCYISKELCDNTVILPHYEEVLQDKKLFHKMFKLFSDNSQAHSAKTLVQKTGDRYLIQNPPVYYNDDILDEISDRKIQ